MKPWAHMAECIEKSNGVIGNDGDYPVVRQRLTQTITMLPLQYTEAGTASPSMTAPAHTTEAPNKRSLASLTLENDEVVIYDPDDSCAWIQSNVAIAIDEL